MAGVTGIIHKVSEITEPGNRPLKNIFLKADHSSVVTSGLRAFPIVKTLSGQRVRKAVLSPWYPVYSPAGLIREYHPCLPDYGQETIGLAGIDQTHDLADHGLGVTIYDNSLHLEVHQLLKQRDKRQVLGVQRVPPAAEPGSFVNDVT